jgi:hypothetical protein
MLEAWLVHIRNLLDFFHPRGKSYPDDVEATDFFYDPSSWEAMLPALTAAEEERRTDINKLLAHISNIRHLRDSDWSVAEHAVICRRLDLFFTHLPKRRRGWFPRTQKLQIYGDFADQRHKGLPYVFVERLSGYERPPGLPT